MKKPIIDMHCDTILRCLQGQSLRDMEGTHINIRKMKAGGVAVQCFALFIMTNGDGAGYGFEQKSPYDVYKALLQVFQSQMQQNADLIHQVRSAEEILTGIREGTQMALLTMEDAAPVEEKLERFQEFYKDGVRMMTLTWNYENCIAFPNSTDAIAHNTLGLKPFGFDSLERMNELGIIADISHVSARCFWDVIQHSKKPVIASHSCSRRLCDHPRNLSDDQLRALAGRGGMVGINFFYDFLEDHASPRSSIERVVQHMRHIKDVAGAETLGWGSDYDGIPGTLEWGDSAGMPILLDALSPYFTDDELDLICWKNFVRVLKDNE